MSRSEAVGERCEREREVAWLVLDREVMWLASLDGARLGSGRFAKRLSLNAGGIKSCLPEGELCELWLDRE